MEELKGTEAQIEWAERIRMKVGEEFDRVAAAFLAVAAQQKDEERAETKILVGIVEEKRAEVLARTEAGYFIRQWQEMGDQVRTLVFRDPRYAEIREKRAARRG
ncbi:MAG: hypothetical protein K2Q23_07630 [Bryobacteraceae bacterium]|nr:hypothetical protein [Bryobacteraceae bacterium]